MVSYEQEYFTSEGYDEYYDFPAHVIRVDRIISMTNPRSVLDIGCAYGYIVRRLLDRGVYAVGLDISKWCEVQAKRIIPGHFIRHDLTKPLPFNDKVFDLLYCVGVLEHISESEIDRIMFEFERVARQRMFQIAFPSYPDASKTSGHICLHNPEWWINRMPFQSWLFAEDRGIENGCLWYYKG